MYNIVKNDETKKVGKRTIVNLNGSWQIEDSVDANEMPVVYGHTAPIPGLLTSAEPAFEDIGNFESRMYQYSKGNWKVCTGGVVDLPQDEAAMAAEYGVAYQERNYFWCRRTFKAPAAHSFAKLVVLKARFGSKVWINGKEVGENASSFISADYDISDAIRWNEENEIVIRIGAHPGVLPPGNFNMEDCEHEHWHPVWDV